MKSIRFSILCSSILILLCSSCTSTRINSVIDESESDKSRCIYIDSNGYCSNIDFRASGKNLSFDAKVRMPNNLGSIYYYTISVSENHFERMAEDLIIKKFTNYKCNARNNAVEYYATEGESSFAFLNVDDTGHLYYDTSTGISGVLYGELYKYHSFEDSSSYDLPVEMSSAIETAFFFAETYSDLSFSCYRSLVEYDSQKKHGCYKVYLQAEVGGIPICELSSNPTNSFMAKINIGSSGVTYLQGKLCFDNVVRGDLASVMPYDEIMHIFKNCFSNFMYKDNGIVYDASLEYHAQWDSNSTYSLRPIWCFHIQYDDGTFDTISFFADTGDFCNTGVA